MVMASSVFSSSPVAIIVLITSFLLTKAEDLGRAHVRGVNKSKYPASMRGLQIEEWTGDECPCGVYESCGICLQDDLAGTCKPCKYETKDNIGIYCPVGKGMVRNIDGMLADYQDSSTLAAGGDQNPNGGDQIEVRTVAYRYCAGSSYCFSISTTDMEVMRNTFGPKLGDEEWDDYYQVFYVLGCEGMFGTITTDPPQDCANMGFKEWEVKPEVAMVDGKLIPVSGIDFNATGIDEPSWQKWDLNYCCSEHYCTSSVGRRWGGGGVVCVFLVTGVSVALGLGMLM